MKPLRHAKAGNIYHKALSEYQESYPFRDLTIATYLHRFRIIEAPDFPCGNGNQTAEHILLECGILREERERLIAAVAKTDNWPIKKDMLITKHYKAFAEFTKTMDKIKELNNQ